MPAFHEVVEGSPFAKLTADDEKLIFSMRKMAGFDRIGHVCSYPLILKVVDLRKGSSGLRDPCDREQPSPLEAKPEDCQIIRTRRQILIGIRKRRVQRKLRCRQLDDQAAILVVARPGRINLRPPRSMDH